MLTTAAEPAASRNLRPSWVYNQQPAPRTAMGKVLWKLRGNKEEVLDMRCWMGIVAE